jgi:hypothetical protein
MNAAMKDTTRAGLISRRDAIGLFAATPALGADAALTNVFGGTALVGASVLGADPALACTGASHDLSQLTVEHFEALVGEMFAVGNNLATLRDVRRGPQTPFRQQFAMIFDAPNASIASDLATVSHPAIGQHDLLVTAVGADRKALEICFS